MIIFNCLQYYCFFILIYYLFVLFILLHLFYIYLLAIVEYILIYKKNVNFFFCYVNKNSHI